LRSAVSSFFLVLILFMVRRVWRYKRDNQNP
jgi:hypothetical protein